MKIICSFGPQKLGAAALLIKNGAEVFSNRFSKMDDISLGGKIYEYF
jgi:hypothetical protein